uniref:COX assembly mitochondrial protein n=1 Tax=Rhodosorus marinus TaxID=101924 RepID=A0A7S0BF09_9RHOD|mmetsp:Transcript_12377/g.17955  ORF Transcript_12377/g.17955 Transcript_12377/m.17955 type:complete len:132 (+) Transcript_12377:234-629(+)
MSTSEDLKERLPVPKANILIAAAWEIGQKCAKQNIKFAKCKAEETHIDHCTREAKQVQNCVHRTLVQCNEQCPAEFEEFRHCLQTRPLVLLKLEDCKEHKFKFRNCMARSDKELEAAAEFRNKVWKVEKEQ